MEAWSRKLVRIRLHRGQATTRVAITSRGVSRGLRQPAASCLQPVHQRAASELTQRQHRERHAQRRVGESLAAAPTAAAAATTEDTIHRESRMDVCGHPFLFCISVEAVLPVLPQRHVLALDAVVHEFGNCAVQRKRILEPSLAQYVVGSSIPALSTPPPLSRIFTLRGCHTDRFHSRRRFNSGA